MPNPRARLIARTRINLSDRPEGDVVLGEEPAGAQDIELQTDTEPIERLPLHQEIGLDAVVSAATSERGGRRRRQRPEAGQAQLGVEGIGAEVGARATDQNAPAVDARGRGLARAMLTDALSYNSGSERAIAGLAEINTLLWVVHGLDEFKEEAIDWVDRAALDDIERGERYAAESLIALHEGRIEESIRIAQDVLEKGGVSERLNWTLGLALRAKGEGF